MKAEKKSNLLTTGKLGLKNSKRVFVKIAMEFTSHRGTPKTQKVHVLSKID